MKSSPLSQSRKSDDSGSDRVKEMERQVDLKHPNWKSHHIAITMDGNGRWARQHGFVDRIRGHEAATDAVRATVETAARLHLKALTLYAFSRENWSRPKAEVSALMRLLRRFVIDERPEMMENNIRFIASGCLEDIPADVMAEVDKSRELTAKNTGLTVNLALSYSGREEITGAARELARQVQTGQLKIEDITPERISRLLYAPELGDPDLFIRTSGEHRISNFLLWQVAYSEIYFMDILWPDFRAEHLLEAILHFQSRKRRFGGLDKE